MGSQRPPRAVLHLTTRDAREVPWKNGRGVTRELAVWPEDASFERGDFEWRISASGVDAAGSFSTPDGYGYSLWVVYGVWLAIVAALYPLCKWFGEYKRTHRAAWLSYI